MKAVIVGCGRVGAALAEVFDTAGYEVTIIDRSQAAFERLPAMFRGTAIRGDGTDEDILRGAGAEGADVFLSLTEGDNRNIMAAQLAAEVLRAGKVIAKINDPLRASAYADLGIASLCRTNLMAGAVFEYLGMPARNAPGIMRPTRGHHADHEAEGQEIAAAREG
jgi:trk system potassium uptake protein TrkA